MSDFCQECNDKLLGHDIECGLAGLITEEQSKQGYTMNALCEGCGFVQVDHDGKKVPWPDENKDS